jgi:hypothetical protein
MRVENKADEAVIDALVVQIGEVIDRNSEATQSEILMACMLVITTVVGSIDCRDCRKVAAREIRKMLPQLMQTAMAIMTGQPASQHRH